MKKILFISYYFKPDNSVAAQRMSYWAQNIKEHADVAVDVITTSGRHLNEIAGTDNVFVVPDNKQGLLSRIFKTDNGASWFYSLKQYFLTNSKQYDTIIISGNPFLHFFIAMHLKRLMKCKIILDFRDPFSRNERNVSTSFLITVKRKLLILIEYFFCELADKIIVMNPDCKALLCSRREKIVEIIDNGYDEVNLEQATAVMAFEDSNNLTLIYLGSFAKDRTIENVLSANEHFEYPFNLLHVGRKSSDIEEDSRIKSIGLVPYVEAIGYAKGADVGLILASGKTFESTTKIFDYIGLNLPILIVTNGVIKTGNVHQLVKNYPMVWWAENNIESIKISLKEISEFINEISSKSFNSDAFSRNEGLKKLVRVIESID